MTKCDQVWFLEKVISEKACKGNQMFLIKKKKAQWFSDTYILLNLF